MHPAAVAAGLLNLDIPSLTAPYVFSTQFGRELALVGTPIPDADVVVRTAPGTDGVTVLWFDETPHGAGGSTGSARLLAGFAVERPHDVPALRKLLADGATPKIRLAEVADGTMPLRSALAAWVDGGWLGNGGAEIVRRRSRSSAGPDS
jgi:hypothetical protein